jgi:hypothetical protein
VKGPVQLDAGGAAAIASELQALRASRASCQTLLLQQQAMRNSLLSSLGDHLQVCIRTEWHNLSQPVTMYLRLQPGCNSVEVPLSYDCY